jgi:formate/nitrite transporter FocA (FNT family)
MRKSQEEAAKKQRKQQMAEIAKRKREAGKGGRFGGMSMAVSYFFFIIFETFFSTQNFSGEKIVPNRQ